jgi:hypothetical protein
LDIASICFTDISVEFRKKHKSWEEKKDESTLRDSLTESIAQFSEIVIKAEQEADKNLMNL